MTTAIRIFLPWFLLSLSMTFSSTFAYTSSRGMRVDAAYSKGNELYLISGSKYVMLRARREIERGSITRLGLPATAKVHAAIGGSTSTDAKFFYTYNGVYYASGYEGTAIPSLIRSSIDAAGDRMGTQYFFKGCYYVRKWPRSSYWLETRTRLTQLPCHIDAAWREGYSMVVLQGSRVWLWGHNGVTGPTDFSQRYELKTLVIG